MASITVIYYLYRICLVRCFCAEVIFEFNTGIFHTFAKYYFGFGVIFRTFITKEIIQAGCYAREQGGQRSQGSDLGARSPPSHHIIKDNKIEDEDGEIQNPGDHLNEEVKK